MTKPKNQKRNNLFNELCKCESYLDDLYEAKASDNRHNSNIDREIRKVEQTILSLEQAIDELKGVES